MPLQNERIRNYSFILICAYVFIWLFFLFSGAGYLDANKKPIGGDFIQFYAASRIMESGPAAWVYNIPIMLKAQEVILAAPMPGPLPMFSTPVVLPYVFWLAWLPYLLSYAAFMILSASLCLASLKPTGLDRKSLLVLFLAYPGTFQSVIQGQVSMLFAALLGGAFMTLERRPLVSGALAAMALFKPHLVLGYPLALAAGKKWKALLSFILASGLVFFLVSALFGTAVWRAYFDMIGVAQRAIGSGSVNMAKVMSMFATASSLGLPKAAAYACQVLFALSGIFCMARVWIATADARLRTASALAICLMLPHYVFEYDWMLLAAAIFCLAKHHLESGKKIPRLQIAALVAAFAAPLASTPLAAAMRVQLASLALGFFAYAVFRAARESSLGKSPYRLNGAPQ